MPQFSVSVTLDDPNDIQRAIDVLGAMKNAVITVKTGGPIPDPTLAVATTIVAAAGDTLPWNTAETSTGPTATTAASLSDAQAELAAAFSPPPPPPPAETAPKRTRASSKKPPEDIVIYDAKGEKLAGYTHSAHAAERFLTEWKKITDPAELDAMKKANMPSLQRLTPEDMTAIANDVAAHANEVKNPPKLPEVPASGTEAELASMFSAPVAVSTEAAAAPAEPKMDKVEFMRRMVATVAQPLGAQEASRWMHEDLKFNELGSIPEDRWVEVLALGQAHVKTLAAAAA